MQTERANNNHRDETGDWVSLQEASALLGVAASTLRRWGDDGRVPMKRTLGGHRRFSRAAIDRLAAGQSAEMAIAHGAAPQRGWSFDTRDLARQEWHNRFTAGPLTDRMRGLGQRLLGLLIQYINRREDDARFLVEARAVGETYGRESRAADVSLHDTVEAFLFFRSAFSQLAMPLPGIAQPTDLAEAAGLHSRLDRFMNAILLGVIAGHEKIET
jgi:excisionase family DNA binding protein